jgi:hypothetical protein
MISLRLTVPAVLAAAVIAGCFTYLISPPLLVEADHPSPPTAPNFGVQHTAVSTRIDRLTDDEEKAVAVFQQAADAILRRAANTRASAATDELPVSVKIPLPKRRPIARPQ